MVLNLSSQLLSNRAVGNDFSLELWRKGASSSSAAKANAARSSAEMEKT